jgi:putative hydrolase of the HAD superfamily
MTDIIRKTMIKALIFDLDDTLVVEQASAEAAFLETCELAKTKYGINPQELNITVRNICRKL